VCGLIAVDEALHNVDQPFIDSAVFGV